MGTKSQRKGREGEISLTRTLQENGFQVRVGDPSNHGRTPDIVGLDGIHIECKRVEKLNLSTAMLQAIRDSEKFGDGSPTIFHRKNREGWLVTMRMEDWLGLYKRACACKNRGGDVKNFEDS